MLYSALRSAGFDVRIVATTASLYFFNPATIEPLDPASPTRNARAVILDSDEWPGRDEGQRYERGEPVLHIELRRWADLFLIAPLDANTLAKLANGLCDNCLTSVWRAWEPTRPMVLAPAMNTLMWQHPLTRRHLRMLGVDAGAAHVPGHLDELGVIDAINDRSRTLRIVPPQVKNLACGDIGVGAIAEADSIIAAVNQLLLNRTPAE